MHSLKYCFFILHVCAAEFLRVSLHPLVFIGLEFWTFCNNSVYWPFILQLFLFATLCILLFPFASPRIRLVPFASFCFPLPPFYSYLFLIFFHLRYHVGIFPSVFRIVTSSSITAVVRLSSHIFEKTFSGNSKNTQKEKLSIFPKLANLFVCFLIVVTIV